MAQHNQPSAEQAQLRADAMKKEIKRLRTTAQKQSTKISKLRLSLVFQLIFFSSLLSFLLLMGFIVMPGHGKIPDNIVRVDTVFIEQPATLDTLQPLPYQPHSAAIPKDNYKGILFAIQIGAYKDLDLTDYKNNLLGLKQDTYDSINQFTLGEFMDYDRARDFLSIMQSMGFKQAHIMSYKNGYRLQLQKAMELWHKEKSLEYNNQDSLANFGSNANSFALLEK